MAKSMWPVTVLASDICEDIGDSNERYHLYIMKKILMGYKRLHIFVDREVSVKTVVLPYGNSIPLPDDFILETKVGIRKNGRICVLSLDGKMPRVGMPLSGNETAQQINSILDGSHDPGQYFSFYNYVQSPGSVGELYGMGSGFKTGGIYNIDRTNGELQVGSYIPEDCEIVIEYKSDGISEGLKLFPSEMVECLEAWAKWKYYADKQPNMADRYEQRYDKEYFRLKRLYSVKPASYYAYLFKECERPTVR